MTNPEQPEEFEYQEPVKDEEPVVEVKEETTSHPTAPITNATQSEDWSKDKLTNTKVTYTFSLPSVPLTRLTEKLSEFKNLKLNEESKELNDWRKVNEEAVDFYTTGSLYQSRFFDEKSKFEQGVRTSDEELKSISNLKFKQTDGELKGELAVLKVSKLLGLGDVLSIPLPHSGIWVTIKPPTEKDLIDFYNSIFQEKIILGRATFGLTLTNFSVHINNKLFDFIIKHIHSVNYIDINKNDLKNYILVHDFPILAWGFASTIYPNGFDYQRACVNDLDQCSHVAKAVVNMCKLLWVDNSSLTEAQKNILSESRPNKLSLDHYKKFIAEHSRTIGQEFTLKNKKIKFKLRVPTFAEYTADGLAWVTKINNAIDALITENDKDQEARLKLLDQYVKSSVLKQFNHFVDFIETDENVISDRDTINEVLEIFSSDDEIRTEVTESVLKFKANTTLALVGIPEYKCPNCGMPQNPDPLNPKLVNVIPLDVMNLFFTLITLRIAKISERDV